MRLKKSTLAIKWRFVCWWPAMPGLILSPIAAYGHHSNIFVFKYPDMFVLLWYTLITTVSVFAVCCSRLCKTTTILFYSFLKLWDSLGVPWISRNKELQAHLEEDELNIMSSNCKSIAKGCTLNSVWGKINVFSAGFQWQHIDWKCFQDLFQTSAPLLQLSCHIATWLHQMQQSLSSFSMPLLS